ncbi:MAG: DUF6076 domain-containing protein [Oscillospiraceae bacterium]|nr:DUF6076 domain-containing protein [Oscillospiraceae bacterium]
MERCVDLCKLYMKTGEYRQEEAAEIRNSIAGCHKYFEQNLRSVFEKIVIDCWVEYICRQNEIGIITLWNNYIPCKNEFEKAVFMRLSEYRHGHAINQWVNILKIQEYANIKVDFIFSGKLRSSAEAAARANYFDLMFNVVANELGYDLNSTADSKVFTMGRTPNSPFIMSSVSREIVRNLLTDLRYSDDKNRKVIKNEIVSDQLAMDAFSSMKLFLPPGGDNIVETMIKSLSESPMKVFMPTSLKAAIDLEIDAIIENGGYLQHCALCKDYYLRSEDYDFDYCDRLSKNGRSCREVMVKKGAKERTAFSESVDAALLHERCDRLYKEMSSRINVEFTQRDFSDWCRYMNTMRDNILSGIATLKDFESFAEYSRAMSFLPNAAQGEKKRISEKVKERQEAKDEKGRTVKPFVPPRVDRKDMIKPESMPEYYEDEEMEEEVSAVPVRERVSSKVIRGVNPDSFSASGGVVIPYGTQAQPPTPLYAEPILKTSGEESIKIYNVKTKEKPGEYVKVFKPKKQPIISTPLSDKPVIPKPVKSEPAQPPVSPPKKIPAFSMPPAREERVISAGAPALSVPKLQDREREESPVGEAPAREERRTQREFYASQKTEYTQELGFTDILKGLERKDGFTDESIPTDSEGVPVSHKTKRVMDAIFKQSKPSLFINMNKDE